MVTCVIYLIFVRYLAYFDLACQYNTRGSGICEGYEIIRL